MYTIQYFEKKYILQFLEVSIEHKEVDIKNDHKTAQDRRPSQWMQKDVIYNNYLCITVMLAIELLQPLKAINQT